MQKPSKALLREWNAKLAASGFQDAERTLRTGERLLYRWDSSLQLKVSATEALERTEYYRLARLFLQTHSFNKDTHRQIWQLFADGATERAIAKQLNVNRTLVNMALRYLKGVCYGHKLPRRPRTRR